VFGGGARLGERGWGADAHAAEAALCVVRGIDQRPLALILTLPDPNPDPNSIVLQQYSPAGATKAIKQHGHLASTGSSTRSCALPCRARDRKISYTSERDARAGPLIRKRKMGEFGVRARPVTRQNELRSYSI